MDFNAVGQRIREYRISKKLRQEDLAERVGLSSNYIGMIERGEKTPSLETFVAILNSLEVSADMVLADVLTVGYTIKNSLLNEKLSALSKSDRDKIYEIIDAFIKHAE